MGRQVFVDGYNVIHCDQRLAEIAAHSLELARTTLVAQLAADPKLRFDAVTVVFDGAAVPGVRAARGRGHVRVRFSRPGQSADDLIRDLIAAAGAGPVVVISNDREVRRHASFAGGTALGIRRQPLPPPAARPSRLDPPEDDEPPAPTFGRKKGNPKRAPRGRNRDAYW